MLTVSATGTASLPPDTIQISFTLKALSPDYDDVIETAALQLQDLRTCLYPFEFTREDLKTTYYNVNTKYESVKNSEGNYKQEFVGYEVMHQLSLSFAYDMQKLSRVIKALSICPAKPEFNLVFTVADEQALVNLALQNATALATQRANLLAESFQVIIQEIASIDMVDAKPYIQRRDYQIDYMVAEASFVDIQPEDVKTEMTISVAYHIR